MENIKSISIEALIKPMKNKKLTHGIGELDGERLEINLDNLFITFGKNHIDLARLSGTMGGYRYFFICPVCDRQCRKLYKRSLLYACGICQQVYKDTLNRSKTDCQYYWERALREARKVEPDWSPKRGGYMFDSFPERPKYMRQSKYYRHYRKFINYARKGDSLWLSGIAKI